MDPVRGKHPLYVFPFGKPDDEGNETTVHRMNDSAWKKARIRAAKKWQEKFLRPAHDGFTRNRIHDLKHTFGRRLRAAGVTEGIGKRCSTTRTEASPVTTRRRNWIS